MKKILITIISFVFILSIFGCSCNNKVYESKTLTIPHIKAYLNKDINGEYEYVYPFNTSISLIYYKDDEGERVSKLFKDEYVKLHMLFDWHYYYYDNKGNLINNLKVINESNGEIVKVDEDVISILKEGIKFTKLSKGKFNIGIGKLVNLWNGFINVGNVNETIDLTNKKRFNYIDGIYKEDNLGNYIYEYGLYLDISNYNRCQYNKETDKCEINNEGNYLQIDGIVPNEKQIEEAIKCVPNYQNIENTILIDDVNNTIKINNLSGCNGSVEITLAALAKSYVAEKISNDERFKEGNYLVNAGGSTIKVIGKNLSRGNGEWHIGVSDSYLISKGCKPKSECASYFMKLDENISVSTSSGDEKHYFYKENYYHHIIDSTSGYPNKNRFAVTSICKNAMYADIATTAIMSMDIDEIKDFLKKLKEENIDMEIMIQDKDGDSVKVMATNKIKELISIRYENEMYIDYLNSIVIEELSYES